MATVRKLKSKRFLAEVRKNGHYKSKTFDSKVKAMAWAVRIPTESGLGGRRWYAEEVKYWIFRNREPVI